MHPFRRRQEHGSSQQEAFAAHEKGLKAKAVIVLTSDFGGIICTNEKRKNVCRHDIVEKAERRGEGDGWGREYQYTSKIKKGLGKDNT